MISKDHRINRIQMKWMDSKYKEEKGISEFEKSGMRSIAFIDTSELQRMRVLVSKNITGKRGFHTNEEWFTVIDGELKYRSRRVNTIAYTIAQDIKKINTSRSSVSNILKQISEIIED